MPSCFSEQPAKFYPVLLQREVLQNPDKGFGDPEGRKADAILASKGTFFRADTECLPSCAGGVKVEQPTKSYLVLLQRKVLHDAGEGSGDPKGTKADATLASQSTFLRADTKCLPSCAHL